MDELFIPVTKPSFEFGFELVLLGSLHLMKQEAELLSKRVQALPPVVPAVLIPVTDEDFVEEVVDIVKHGLVVRSCNH